MKNIGKGIGGALLSLAFVFGIFVAAGSTAQAQYRNDDRYYRRDRNRDDDRRDRNRDWRRDGRHDNGRHLGWYKNGKYRNDGYRNDGYKGGYNNGRYRNGGYGNYGYDQQEVNRGYQQGLNTGSSDARRGQSYSPERSHFYRDSGYSQAFREGFVRGYDQGYRQYAGYNNRRYGNSGGLGNILGGIFRP
jgi:hypothetical protein